ncbi:MAG TPA: cob(I)yrinic acid a,c-diamide adenosyltransferase [Armatimonadota bacterium]|nr:cob(I)yrinic acid a,c-diamide adenosyltransferase [Armatimonadota bacterium]
MPRRGLVQVYTGSGKGKTTAAWGLALRAVGAGCKVAVVQFLKPQESSEVKAAKSIPNLSIYGKSRPYDARLDQRESAELREDSRRDFGIASVLIASSDYDMVVLDEMNIVLEYGFVTCEEMLDVLRDRPDHTEVVLTGRYAPNWLIEAADLVTEMKEIKHPANGGVQARKGIEF